MSLLRARHVCWVAEEYMAENMHGLIKTHSCTHSSVGHGESAVAHVAVDQVRVPSTTEPVSDSNYHYYSRVSRSKMVLGCGLT